MKIFLNLEPYILEDKMVKTYYPVLYNWVMYSVLAWVSCYCSLTRIQCHLDLKG